MGHTIYLVGARAAGKTTFGGALARQLGCNYVDTDIHLRETTGETVADICSPRRLGRFPQTRERRPPGG